ncbi:DgyrCDS14541 [Dimorphilus gyrociliatus]|uniref:DgyrCDS14541 n=1 Tax=Dimorphilus gyrociliatus TaxID=2664684 RepID=A0A7I8WE90_9ANNE|nr:DgyrCDS14541 [Dimorphilus gyrociliatus]
MKSLHCKSFVNCMFFAIIPLVIGEDDIARNKLTFQSTTTYPHIASLATDSTIEINDPLKCSKTNQTKGKAWWTVDLEKVYTVTKVCILNVNSPNAVNLKNFKIKVSDYPLEGVVCSTVSNPVITPSSTASSQYGCYFCGTPLDGSFIYIEHQDEAVNLHICDIKVTGTYKEKRDYSAVSIESTDLFGSEYSSPQSDYNKTIDNDYITYFETKLLFAKPKLVIRLPTTVKVFAIMLLANQDSSNTMKYSFVYVNYIPNTMGALPDEVCFNYYTPPQNGLFESVFRKCNSVKTGRYIITGADPGFPVKFQLSELVIYGQEVKNVDKYVMSFSHKDKIVKHESDGIVVPGASFLTNDEYFGDASVLVVALKWKISFAKSLVNTLCLTISNVCAKTAGEFALENNVAWPQDLPYIVEILGQSINEDILVTTTSGIYVCESFEEKFLIAPFENRNVQPHFVRSI